MRQFDFKVYGNNYNELTRNAECELETLGGEWIITDMRVTKGNSPENRYVAVVTAELLITLGDS